MTDAQPDTPPATMTRGLTLLFAFSTGAAIGNLYWAQPLLKFIADDLHSRSSTTAWLVTATQLGYAVGIVLIVPLGDVRNRRRLVPLTMLGAAAALGLCALAPSVGVLLVTISLLGITTVAGQLLIPLAGDLAPPSRRGTIVGTVVSGALIGILTSRTISGLVAGLAGWRVVFAAAAVVDVALAVVLYLALPPLAPKTRMPYRELFASAVGVIRQERSVRWTLVLGALGFSLFTMFWTTLTLRLSSPPFSYSVSLIGLFGLAGLAGAISAQRVGRLHDRGLSLPATGAAWALVLASFVLAAVSGSSIALLLVVIVLLDIAIQALNILNQARVFAVSHEARSRLNTAFVTSNFIGGAIGSAAASLLWSLDGWTAVTIAGAAVSAVAIAIWAAGRRGPLIVPDPVRA
jgi:predicted MFS family arabinose efflux permease